MRNRQCINPLINFFLNSTVSSASSSFEHWIRQQGSVTQLNDVRKKLDEQIQRSYHSMPSTFFPRMLADRRRQVHGMLNEDLDLMIHSCVANQI